jgi:hypothetical protein
MGKVVMSVLWLSFCRISMDFSLIRYFGRHGEEAVSNTIETLCAGLSFSSIVCEIQFDAVA